MVRVRYEYWWSPYSVTAALLLVTDLQHGERAQEFNDVTAVTRLMGCFGQGMMILVIALSHLLRVGSVILFRAYSVAETALALGGSFCHRLSRLIDLDSALASRLRRLRYFTFPYPKHCQSRFM